MVQILQGYNVLLLALNLPGPVAAARLIGWGASVTKIEPPGGDPLASVCADWYAALCAGGEVLTLNLKEPDGRSRFESLLAESDLLVTSVRPSALTRLGLGWDRLHERCPNLCHVAITGYPSPDERPGHDLTYQASLGLVTPPQLPVTLLADLGGAERAVSAAMALLLARERGQGAGYMEVSLADAAVYFAAPLQHGLTNPEGALGGALPVYNLYAVQDGWIALAALEIHFWEALAGELGLEPLEMRYEDLQRFFLTHGGAYWEEWGKGHDLPIAVVKSPWQK
jgi:alpha-methylacyl-CoA racemase